MLHIHNGRMITPRGLEAGELWCEEGKIVARGENPAHSIDAKGLIVAPGYIDLQVNGAYGVDFTAQPEKVGDAARQLPLHGVTSFLPTILSTRKEDYRRLITMLQPRKISGGASILGIHLEGPFLSPLHRGAHSNHYLSEPDDSADLHGFYGTLAGVKIITLAPELAHMSEAIHRLRERKIIVAIGHSGASLELISHMIGEGVSLITHLFNAMPLFHHRQPSLIDAALLTPRLSYTLICDGVHLDEQAIQLAWKLNPQGLILVSDAMGGQGSASGACYLGEQEVDVKGGAAYVAGSKTLAGSLAGLDVGVRNFQAATGCSVLQAVEAATSKPAKLLGIEDSKGVLKPGADGDIIFLDDALNVRAAFVSGIQVF